MKAVELARAPAWETLCPSDDVPEGLGVRALYQGEQVAIYRVRGALFGISAVDPFTGIAVLSRGIVGDLKGRLVVASPLYKQHFDLCTGECLEDDSVRIKVYLLREQDGYIQITGW